VKKFFSLPIFVLILGVQFDLVVGPIVLLHKVDLHCTAAAVIVIGLRRGPWRGMLAGWLGGLLLASMTSEPLGMPMLSLGIVGFLAGHARGIGAWGLPALDVAVLLLLLVVKSMLAKLLASVALGTPAPLGIGGILLSAIIMGRGLWHNPLGDSMKETKLGGTLGRTAGSGGMLS
jgi:hypothetical protein